MAELDQQREPNGVDHERDHVDRSEPQQVHQQRAAGLVRAKREAAVQDERGGHPEQVGDVQAADIADPIPDTQLAEHEQAVPDRGVDPAEEQETEALVAEESGHQSREPLHRGQPATRSPNARR